MRSALCFVTVILLLAGCSERLFSDKEKQNRPAFRVTGYLLKSDITGRSANYPDLSKVNYINIAFLNPDTAGNFSTGDSLVYFIQIAHNQHIKVLASIGGGLAPSYYSSLLQSGKRLNLINNLVLLTKDLNLDGIDVDLEGERIDSNYEAFLTGLKIALKQDHKLLTAAVATVYGSGYTDLALNQFDYINIMSYDKTGPWRPEQPGQHAPYNMAVDDITYWQTIRNIPKEKLSLGLPFYGYGFGAGVPGDLSYKDLLARFPNAENSDSVKVREGGVIYYNGLATIKAKTRLAMQQTGGIMIWQLKQDASGKNSLLRAINGLIFNK